MAIGFGRQTCEAGVAREKKSSAVRLAAGALSRIVTTLFVVSGVVNVLALTGSFYMLQVYDRVVFHAGISTLQGLVAGMAIVILFGLLSSMLLNMIVVPSLYLRFGRPTIPITGGAR